MTPAEVRTIAVYVLMGVWGATAASASTYRFAVNASNPQQSGRATFDVSTGSMTLILENTAGPAPIGKIASVLDGLSFTFTGGSVAGLTLQSATTANGYLNCSTGTCVSSGPPEDADGNPLANLGWLIGGSSPIVLAPQGLHPGGIVNSNITATDGIRNEEHSPWVVGPVTFLINFTQNTQQPLGIGSVNFYFGTGPDILSGTLVPGGGGAVPEPAALVLVGAGLLALAHFGRRRRLTR